MKLHEVEDIGGDWRRMAVPGGWLYWDPATGPHVEGCAYVPDPTAEHVREANGGVK